MWNNSGGWRNGEWHHNLVPRANCAVTIPAMFAVRCIDIVAVLCHSACFAVFPPSLVEQHRSVLVEQNSKVSAT